ncbi:MAG: hypothetical protein PHY56_00655 [Candidatus Omnitrophica bacterium]|nr:hypothetical protein [Candidatus Omnitrophota bacterium]
MTNKKLTRFDIWFKGFFGKRPSSKKIDDLNQIAKLGWDAITDKEK